MKVTAGKINHRPGRDIVALIRPNMTREIYLFNQSPQAAVSFVAPLLRKE
jgi:hypothetical protein